MARGIEFRGFSNANRHSKEDQHSIHLSEDGNENASQLHQAFRRVEHEFRSSGMNFSTNFYIVVREQEIYVAYRIVSNGFIKLIRFSPRELASHHRGFLKTLANVESQPFLARERRFLLSGRVFKDVEHPRTCVLFLEGAARMNVFGKNRSPRVHPTLCETRTSRDD